jgi:hypothetical protein
MKKLAIPHIPRPHDIASEVSGLDAKLAGFSRRIRDLESERAALAAELASESAGPALTPRNARVAALLGESDVVPDKPSRMRLTEIAVELADLREAFETAGRMRRVALSKASAAICAGIAPEYRTRVRAVVEALKSAHAATLSLRELTNALEEQEVEWTSLGVAFPSFIGNPCDLSGPLAHYPRDMVSQGHIGKYDLPRELQPK